MILAVAVFPCEKSGQTLQAYHLLARFAHDFSEALQSDL
jgi:hypothetical protein